MTFRFYRPGDEEALTRLFGDVFGRSMSPAYWSWKLLGRPGPLERVVLAESAGEPVFQIGGIPCSGLLSGRPASLVVAVDAMTRRDHRRKGLLTTGSRRLFRRWREQGVDLVLGLPNDQYGSRTRAIGWRPLFALQWRVRLLRPERVLARRTGSERLARSRWAGRLWDAWWSRGGATPADLEIGERVPDARELDALWEDCRAGFEHGLVRDAAWWQWRYLDPPGEAYRLLGAWREGRLEGLLSYRIREENTRKVAFIAEVLTSDARPHVERGLLRAVLGRAREEGVELVATLVPSGSPRERALRRSGFLRSWGAFTVHCVPLRHGVDASALRDPRAWSVAGGSFDIV